LKKCDARANRTAQQDRDQTVYEKQVADFRRHRLLGQEPPWQKSVGHGPLGHVSQAWPVDLLRPTAKPESSFCTSELLHLSQVCF